MVFCSGTNIQNSDCNDTDVLSSPFLFFCLVVLHRYPHTYIPTTPSAHPMHVAGESARMSPSLHVPLLLLSCRFCEESILEYLMFYLTMSDAAIESLVFEYSNSYYRGTGGVMQWGNGLILFVKRLSIADSLTCHSRRSCFIHLLMIYFLKQQIANESEIAME